ncbi:MAG: hypothetical protein OWS03_04390 [Alicyclobacillaceae bacterium]|nr:hypothetical protein [Alicyclobacillaceae bacterium]
MNELARRLLAEKLVDDFSEDDVQRISESGEDELTEKLKELIPVDKRELLFFVGGAVRRKLWAGVATVCELRGTDYFNA